MYYVIEISDDGARVFYIEYVATKFSYTILYNLYSY
jgi:hypothetical protein